MKKLVFIFAILFASNNAIGNKIAMDSDRNCMALSLYFEARGEILSASVAVAELIHTRIKSNFYGNTACDVVKYKSWSDKLDRYICSFDWYCDRASLVLDLSDPIERHAWDQALVITDAYLSSTPPCFNIVKTVSLFHDDSIVPWWAKMPSVKKVAVIGRLHFYEERRGGVLISKNDSPSFVNVRS